MMSYEYPHPVSRTYQYKKITKPLLERKRRARINKCLDELKNLMIDTLEADVEDVSKLEKADILELTVRHLQKLQGSKCPGFSSTVTTTDEISAENRWLSGFGHCAAEAYRFLSTLPGEGAERLAKHLAAGLQKNLQASSSQKTNVLTQILASLNLTTDLVTPSVANSNIKNNRVTCSDQSATCRGAIREVPENRREQQHAVKSVKTDVEIEDEEEIDVERIDDADPMWRPW